MADSPAGPGRKLDEHGAPPHHQRHARSHYILGDQRKSTKTPENQQKHPKTRARPQLQPNTTRELAKATHHLLPPLDCLVGCESQMSLCPILPTLQKMPRQDCKNDATYRIQCGRSHRTQVIYFMISRFASHHYTMRTSSTHGFVVQSVLKLFSHQPMHEVFTLEPTS